MAGFLFQINDFAKPRDQLFELIDGIPNLNPLHVLARLIDTLIANGKLEDADDVAWILDYTCLVTEKKDA